MVRVHLHGLLRDHVGAHRAVAQSLRLHDALHVRRPAVLRGHQDNRGVGDAGADQHLLDLVAEDLLDELAKRLVLRLELLRLLLFLRYTP